jgi:transposase-like protein
MRKSAIPLQLTAFSTGWCTQRTGLNCKVNRCERRKVRAVTTKGATPLTRGPCKNLCGPATSFEPACQYRRSPYLKQHHRARSSDHRFVKKRIAASQGFRSFDGAVNTIAGYEAMNMIRKGQIRWLAKANVAGQAKFIEQILGVAA